MAIRDVTYCLGSNDNCKKKDECKRYFKHYNFEDEYAYSWMDGTGCVRNCYYLFMPIEEEGDDNRTSGTARS